MPEVQEQPRRIPSVRVVGKPPRQERLDSGYRFGSIDGARILAILKRVEEGYLRDWGDLSEYMVKSDTTISSVYFTRKVRVTSQPWYLEAGVARSRDQESVASQAADFCTQVLDGIEDFDSAMHSLLGGTGEGVAVNEIDWQRDSDLWVPARLKWRHIRRFRFDDQWDLRLYDKGKHGAGRYGLELPKYKFVVHTPADHAGYPTRNGALQTCVWLWYFKRWLTKTWAHVTSNQGSPLVLGRVPKNTERAVRDEMHAGLQALSYDHASVLEAGNEIDIRTEGMQAIKGETPQQTFIRYVDDEIAKLMLGYTDATGPGENGARAAVESRADEMLAPRTEYDGRQLWSTLRRDLLTPILWFNRHRFGGVMPPVPHGVFGSQESGVSEIRIGVLNQGVVKVNEVRASEGLPPLEEGEKTEEGLGGEDFLPNVSLLQSQQAPQPGGGGGGLPGFADDEPAGGQADARPFRRKRKTRRSSRARQMSLPLETTTSRTSTRSLTSPLARVLSGQSADPASSSRNPRSR